MFFHIAKYFFNPHSPFVKAESGLQIRQFSCQTPGLFFTKFPICQQIDPVNVRLREFSLSKPEALTSLVNVAAKGNPLAAGL